MWSPKVGEGEGKERGRRGEEEGKERGRRGEGEARKKGGVAMPKDTTTSSKI